VEYTDVAAAVEAVGLVLVLGLPLAVAMASADLGLLVA